MWYEIYSRSFKKQYSIDYFGSNLTFQEINVGAIPWIRFIEEVGSPVLNRVLADVTHDLTIQSDYFYFFKKNITRPISTKTKVKSTLDKQKPYCEAGILPISTL